MTGKQGRICVYSPPAPVIKGNSPAERLVKIIKMHIAAAVFGCILGLLVGDVSAFGSGESFPPTKPCYTFVQCLGQVTIK
jgi:hypothetical protein